MIINRIALGTANFFQEYNGHRVKDVDKILDYCKEVGITTLDCAVDYGGVPDGLGKDFDVILKMNVYDDDGVFDERARRLVLDCQPRVVMAHKYDGLKELAKCWCHSNFQIGVSIYDYDEIKSLDMVTDVIQCPYSLYDRRMEPYLEMWHKYGIENHVRSIFMRGKILDHIEGWDYQKCIDFVLMNRNVDKLIMGVDSVDMLKNNVYHILKMEEAYKDYNGELDLRKF
jgi:hypothetical protein